MLTVFSIPKPFIGEVGTIQRNAVRSWSTLGSDVQVILAGDEAGVAETAREFDAAHAPDIARSPLGTPRLDDAFAQVTAVAANHLLCFINSDIVLLDGFVSTVRAAAAAFPRLLVVGETTDLAVGHELDLAVPACREALRLRAEREGKRRGPTAIDYFVFTPGLFDPMPAFVVGRAGFDNWLIWRARGRAPVIDATAVVTAVHQHHDYSHVAGGFEEAHRGEEARRNFELAGGSRHIYTIYDASHRLRADGTLRRHLGATLRVRENARKAMWRMRNALR